VQIHSVQHELRTPLHGMLALISSLSSDLKGHVKHTENEQRLNDINSLGAQLVSVLDDFRDFASHTIEAKTAEEQHEILPNEEADLYDIIDDVASEVWKHQVAAMKAAKGPDVRIPPPPELILTLDGSLQSRQSLVSVDSFRKVAKKLIDNAMKFTSGEGFVEVSLAPHRMQDVQEDGIDRPTRNYVRMTVEDTGRGMTNDFVSDVLFTPFAKADKFKSGAGLSMALCSSLVRRMGGSMQVSSDEGRGTTVIVLIP
jgi:signal transduction histidine kinase